MKKVNIFYFSGSGNTKQIALHVKLELEKHDYIVNLCNMEEGQVDSKDCELVGLMFPVAIQSTYPIVWNFVKNMEDSSNKIFMIDTLQAFSGGVVGPMKNILSKKGYICVGAIEIKMSSSMETNYGKSTKTKSINEKAKITATKFILDLLNGKTCWKRLPILGDLMRQISKSKKIWVMQSKALTVNHSSCIKCKLCMKKCPTGAINMDTGHVVINPNLCISCMRCVNKCPTNSFRLKNKQVYQNK